MFSKESGIGKHNLTLVFDFTSTASPWYYYEKAMVLSPSIKWPLKFWITSSCRAFDKALIVRMSGMYSNVYNFREPGCFLAFFLYKTILKMNVACLFEPLAFVHL